jgi:hypothetical protein
MSTLLGELIGRVEAAGVILEDPGRPENSGDGAEAYVALAAEINRVVDPPVAVTAGNVFIRSMDVVSDEINEHGGRFSPDEFERLCELIVDSPVLVAHDKRQLPVARNFKAEVITRDERPWVKVWFYWPHETAAARDLASRIDSGVVQEVSIGFEFKRPECSVCGQDIRECEHRPFVEYRHADGTRRPAHYIYREIVRVLETSLVYRGATPGTRIGAGLFFAKPDTPPVTENDASIPPPAEAALPATRFLESLFEIGLANGTPLSSAFEIPSTGSLPERFVVSPIVNGLPVVALKRGGEVLIFDPDRREIGEKLPSIRIELVRKTAGDFAAFGWVIRSSERAKGKGPVLIMEWLGDAERPAIQKSSVLAHRRTVTRLFSGGGIVRAMPYRWAGRDGLSRAVQLVSSPSGCRIHPAATIVVPRMPGFELRRKAYLWARITDRLALTGGKWSYRVALDDGAELCDAVEPIVSVQRYPIGRVVPVCGVLHFGDCSTLGDGGPSIPYTPARRNEPDLLGDVRAMYASANSMYKQENRGISKA